MLGAMVVMFNFDDFRWIAAHRFPLRFRVEHDERVIFPVILLFASSGFAFLQKSPRRWKCEDGFAGECTWDFRRHGLKRAGGKCERVILQGTYPGSLGSAAPSLMNLPVVRAGLSTDVYLITFDGAEKLWSGGAAVSSPDIAIACSRQ
jgi:hypothetical protein